MRFFLVRYSLRPSDPKHKLLGYVNRSDVIIRGCMANFLGNEQIVSASANKHRHFSHEQRHP